MREKGTIILVLLVALGLRLGWVISRGDVLDAALPDQKEYLELGRNLLHEHRLEFFDGRFGQVVKAYRTPGYPVFVAMCGGDVRAIRIVQAVIDSASVLGVYLLASTWLALRDRTTAAIIVALNPFLIFFTSLILTETLFTAMLVWGMVLLARKRWWIGGVVLGVAVLVRPGAVALPVVLGAASCFANRATERAYDFKPWRVTAGIVAITLLVLLPWGIRNQLVLGKWVWLSTNDGATKFDGFNDRATGASDQSLLSSMPQLKQMNELQRDDYLAALANEWIQKNPEKALGLGLKKLERTWSPIPISSEYRTMRNVIIGLVYSVPVDVLIVIGLLSRKMRIGVKVFLAATAIYLSLAASFSVGSLRYRVPAEAPLAVVAAVGVSCLLRKVDVAKQ